MNFPQIRINTQDARIGVDTQNASLAVKQPRAEMSIEQPKAEMSIQQHDPKLTIEQTNAWHNLDLKSVAVRSRENVEHSKQSLLEYLGRTSQEGDELMQIENGGNPIASMAKRNAVWKFDMQTGGMPAYELVKFYYQPGKAEIDVVVNKPIIQTIPRKPQLNYKDGSVEVTMEQYPEVKIDFENLMYKGYQYEQQI